MCATVLGGMRMHVLVDACVCVRVTATVVCGEVQIVVVVCAVWNQGS